MADHEYAIPGHIVALGTLWGIGVACLAALAAEVEDRIDNPPPWLELLRAVYSDARLWLCGR